MANLTGNIETSWTLIAFAREFGPEMGVVECTSKETGEIFKACVCTDSKNNKTFVSFSSKLCDPKVGMQPSEIVAKMAELQIVKWHNPEKDTHGYTLCKKGNSDKYQAIDLGL